MPAVDDVRAARLAELKDTLRTLRGLPPAQQRNPKVQKTIARLQRIVDEVEGRTLPSGRPVAPPINRAGRRRALRNRRR